MRIKKTSQTTPVQAQILNAFSESTVDSYSCDYLNKKTSREIITAYLSNDASFSNDATITLDSSTSTTEKISLSNGILTIGAGVSKILVSSQLYVRYTATTGKVYGFSVMNNTAEVASARCQKSIGQPISASLSNYFVEVNEGDQLKMKFITDAGSSSIGEKSTFLTIEVIE